MRPLKLKVTGWGPYKEHQQIDFSALPAGSLFLITGPTGSGKTTVFDAVSFALFGEVSGSVREKDSLRSDFASPETPTSVELVFSHKNETYHIIRNPRYERRKLRGEGSTVENENASLYGGQEKLLETGGQAVTDAVTRILGLNYRQFKQISMIAQGEFTQLLTASSKERTLIFRDIFQTRIYDVITQILGEKVKVLNGKLDEVKHRMDESAGMVFMSGEVWEKAWNQKNRNYPKLIGLIEAELGEKQQIQKGLEEKKKKLDREYKTLLRKAEQIKQNNRAIDIYEEECRKLERLKEEFKETKARWKSIEAEAKKLPQMEEQIISLRQQCQVLEEKKRQYEMWEQAGKTLALLQKEYLRLDAIGKASKQEYELQDDRYRKASAGVLAQTLQEGMPCPVCGSLNHPAPAEIKLEIPDEQELKRLKRKAENDREAASQAQSKAASALGALKQLENNLGTDDLPKIQEEYIHSQELLSRVSEGKRKLEDLHTETTLLLEKQKAAIVQKKEGIKKPSSMEPMDIIQWNQQIENLERERRHIGKEKEQLQTLLTINQRGVELLKEHMVTRGQLEEVYGNLRKVERAASGSNNRKLVLEQYVLSVYFEDILRAANQRLRAMTGDRYELYRQEESRDRRMKESMEMEVLDQYTGKKRSVKTLSGGELFKAALALALGTSDVVQSYAGGIQVETLFVDEGFGALDGESLSQAIEILTGLGGNSRMIGIVSHVDELKEQVENQIIIEKTNNGSSITTNFMA